MCSKFLRKLISTQQVSQKTKYARSPAPHMFLPSTASDDSFALSVHYIASNLHLSCTSLLVGTISLRSLGENTLVGTIAFLHSDHWAEISLSAYWADISLSVHWAETSLRQHRLIEQLNSPSSIQMHGCPGKRAAFCASQWLSKSATIAQCAVGDSTPGYPFG